MKEFLQCFFVKLGADYAKTSRIIGTSAPNLVFFRNKVKLHPAAVRVWNDAFGTENDSVCFGTAQFF